MPDPRPLPVGKARGFIAAGSRWAWRLEPKLATVYETLISEAYDGAAAALEARTLTAAGTPGAGGWTVPDEDEIGDALRRKYEQRADAASTAIRVEAMRRVTIKGLEFMNVNLEARNALLEGVIGGLGGNIEIADTTRRDIMGSLQQSWKDGLSIPHAARDLRATGAAISKTRSTLIARTELIGAINAGAHALASISNEYAQPGDPTLVKIWLTAEDEKVRDSHGLDGGAGDVYGEGKGIPLDEPFRVGSSDMQFPGDQNGAAEEVCNCRCALSYDESPGALTASEENTVETYTFNGRVLRATGALTASGMPVYALDPADLPDGVDAAEPADLDMPEEASLEVAAARAWTCVLAVTGIETSDGRMLMPGTIRWRELPLTLLMQLELAPEHMGALIVGRIDEVETMPAASAVSAGLMPEGDYAADAEAIVGRGVFDDSMLGDEALRLIADQMLRGVSVDLAPDGVEVIEKVPVDGQEYGDLLELVTGGEIMGATVCAHPAFAEASIMVEALVASAVPGVLRIWTTGVIQRPAPPTLQASAVDYSSHSMIAVHPTSIEAAAIAQPGGQPAGDLHVTLAYLPNADAVDFDTLHKVVAGVAAAHSTITGKVGGAGHFAPDAPVDPDAAPEDEVQDKADEDKPADGPESVTAADAPPTPGPVADPETDPDSEDEDTSSLAAAPLSPHVALIDAPGLSKMRASLCTALDDAGIEYAQNHDFTPHVTLGYDETPGMPAMHCAGSPCTFSHLSVHQGPTRTDHPMGDVEPDGLTASAAGIAPLRPPVDWFTDPQLDEPTPLTVTADGRIFGHLATWGTCHVGIRDACVQPPSSALDYALFHLGHLETAEGELVPVGTFQMDTNHAPLRLGMRAAQEHYDHTGTAVADVRCGEDEHGIWFSGAIRPDLSAVKVRALRAAQISGDWRAHEGRHEFCAGLAVNIPGYPVIRPRTAIAASGAQLGLVAAGVDLRPAPRSPIELSAQRLALLERFTPGSMAASRSSVLERLTRA